MEIENRQKHTYANLLSSSQNPLTLEIIKIKFLCSLKKEIKIALKTQAIRKGNTELN